MTTARAVLLSGVLIAAAIVAATLWSVPRLSEANRYSLVNAGSGTAMRLDRRSGKLVACSAAGCSELADGNTITAKAVAIPNPPPGYVLDK